MQAQSGSVAGPQLQTYSRREAGRDESRRTDRATSRSCGQERDTQQRKKRASWMNQGDEKSYMRIHLRSLAYSAGRARLFFPRFVITEAKKGRRRKNEKGRRRMAWYQSRALDLRRRGKI